MPPKKAPTAEPETKGEEQEPVIPEPEPASPAEAEVQGQRGEETPDPLEGVTFQQLQEHPRYKEDWNNLTAAQKEEREKAYRDGQSAGAKQADAQARQWAAQQEAIKAFESLEQKRIAGAAGDPDAAAEYANAMGDPKAKETYERGRSAKQGPGAQEIATTAVNEAMSAAFQPLKDHPALKGMTAEEHQAIHEGFKGQEQPYVKFFHKYCELIIEKGIAAGRMADDDERIQAAKDERERELLDELGIKYSPEEIKGHTGRGPDHDRVLAGATTTGEEKAAAFEKKHGYRPRNR